MSYIYENMPEEIRESAGYFKTKHEPIPLDQNENFVYGEFELKPYTQIIYYPGAFGVFHDGHVSAINDAIRYYKALGRDVLAVIAPCNPEYSVKKYGAWSPFASNKLRYEAIKESMPEGCVIDLNCMLNYVEDQNFTDLLLHFVERHGFTMHDFVYNPAILSGKDREGWKVISDYSDEVSMFYAPDTTGESTSGKKKFYPDIEQKACILRCHSVAEYQLFLEYFSDQYYDIIPRIIEQEKVDALGAYNEAIRMGVDAFTICKDYAGLMPYYGLSREWLNPFEQAGFRGNGLIAIKQSTPSLVIDSDVFSGSTESFVTQYGHEFVALLRVDPKIHEIIDIDDLRKDDFRYPYVDISSRCSMQAFDIEMHDKFLEFKTKLKEIN